MRNKLITLFIAIITVSACSGAFAATCRNMTTSVSDASQYTAVSYTPCGSSQEAQGNDCIFFEKNVAAGVWEKFKICRCSCPAPTINGVNYSTSNSVPVLEVANVANCDNFSTLVASGASGKTFSTFCCKQCSVTCTADTDFANDGTSGYQKKVSAKHCDCQTGASCHNDTTLWRCADGFWGMRGTGDSTKGTCTKCPDFHGITIHSSYTTSGTTNMYITGCYISAGTYTDTTGTFTVASQCKYEN